MVALLMDRTPRRFRFHIPLRAKKPHQLRLNDAPREKVRVDGSKKRRVSKFFPLERIPPAPPILEPAS